MKAMQKMNARVYDDELCNLRTVMDGALVPGEMLCVGDADSNDRACKGDSGSGLVQGEVAPPLIYGLVSWKPNCDAGSGLGAYTNISYYRTWIEGILETDP
jgi:secreted trypsin-like serine protease